MKKTNKLNIIYGDTTLGVSTIDRQYIFSYEKGGLDSLLVHGKEWLYEIPKPAFWRATTSNDVGSHFSERSAVWLGADMFSQCIDVNLKVNGESIELPIPPLNNKYLDNEYAETVEITFTYQLATYPVTHASIQYTMDENEGLFIYANYIGNSGVPELPAFGIRLIMPTLAKGYKYTGLSGETYPDRLEGGVPGYYEVDGLPVTPYLKPQECGMHMNTEDLTVICDTLRGRVGQVDEYRLKINQHHNKFAFSILPYTPFELENAKHIEELPIPRKTVLTIFGSVRGVGGYDSWTCDVEPEYRLLPNQTHEVSFVI